MRYFRWVYLLIAVMTGAIGVDSNLRHQGSYPAFTLCVLAVGVFHALRGQQ